VREEKKRATCTLTLRNLPAEKQSSLRDHLSQHFRRFGVIVRVSVVEEHKVAYVQFATPAQAAAAVASPEAVFGSRFITVDWAARDVVPPGEEPPPPPPPPPPSISAAQQAAHAAQTAKLRELAAIGKAKEALLEQQVAAQKVLLAKMASAAKAAPAAPASKPPPPAPPPVDPHAALRRQAASAKAAVDSAAAAAEKAAAALRAKYEAALAARGRAKGAPEAPQAAPAAAAPPAAPASFSLDNRPRTLRCTALPKMYAESGAEESLAGLTAALTAATADKRQPPPQVQPGTDGGAVESLSTFATRAAAEAALARAGGWGLVWCANKAAA